MLPPRGGGKVNTMRTKLAVAIAGAGLVLAGTAGSLVAHHAFSAEFDANSPVQFEGTVTKVEWINPHVWLHMDVSMPDGTVENWAFEAGTPNNLFRARVYEAVAATGYRGLRRRLPGKGWIESGERPRSEVPRWPHAVHGLVWHGRTVRTGAEVAGPRVPVPLIDQVSMGRGDFRRVRRFQMRQVFLSGAALVLVVVILALTPLAGQGPTAAEAEATAQAGSAFKTPWGEPDLQGLWTDYEYTPLQRSDEFGDREFLN